MSSQCAYAGDSVVDQQQDDIGANLHGFGAESRLLTPSLTFNLHYFSDY